MKSNFNMLFACIIVCINVYVIGSFSFKRFKKYKTTDIADVTSGSKKQLQAQVLALKQIGSYCLVLSTVLFGNIDPSFLPLQIQQQSFIFSIQKANAVSGGGKDYATKDLRENDFSGQDLSTKDFTQCDATSAKFNNAILTGSRFYRANLQKADFSGAKLTSASLEDTGLLGAKFAGAVLQDAYLSSSILDAETIEGADFTDTQMPDFARKKLCDRVDAKGVNKITGVATRESLFCE